MTLADVSATSAGRPALGIAQAALLLALLLGLQPVMTDLYLPSLPAIARHFDAPLSATQLTMSALILAFGPMQLVWGPVSDRWGRRPVLLASLALLSVASVGAALSPTIATLVAWRAAQGAALAAVVMCARAMVRDLYPPHEGARVMSLALSGLGVLAVAAPLSGGLIAAAFGWRAALGTVAAFATLSLTVIAWRQAVAKEITARGWKRVGFEEGAMTVAFHRDVLASLNGGAELAGIGDTIVVMRRQKDPVEIALYERIARIGDDAFTAATTGLTAGTTERELASRIDAELEAHGSDGPSFPTIVAAGPHAAHPHHDPGDRPIADGEPVIIDMGAMLDGYHGDLTRTIWAGVPTPRLREVYASVEAAQAAGIAAIRTGATWEAPDTAARAAFADAGLAEYLIHGLGHAVGYNVHEQPMMAQGALETFAGGEVMTVEPGLYIPGWGGVRVEDVGVVEADGLRVITHAPKASFL